MGPLALRGSCGVLTAQGRCPKKQQLHIVWRLQRHQYEPKGRLFCVRYNSSLKARRLIGVSVLTTRGRIFMRPEQVEKTAFVAVGRLHYSKGHVCVRGSYATRCTKSSSL